MDWAKYLGKRLAKASWQGIDAVKDALPADTAVKLLEAVCLLLRHEPTVLDVSISCACHIIVTTLSLQQVWLCENRQTGLAKLGRCIISA